MELEGKRASERASERERERERARGREKRSPAELGDRSQDELTNEAEVTVGFEPQLEEAVVLSFGRSQSGQGGASNSPEKERKTKVISQNDTEQDTERKPSRMERRVVAQNGLPPELRRRDYALGKRERMTDYAGPLPHLKWSTPGRELYKTYALWMEPHGPLCLQDYVHGPRHLGQVARRTTEDMA